MTADLSPRWRVLRSGPAAVLIEAADPVQVPALVGAAIERRAAGDFEPHAEVVAGATTVLIDGISATSIERLLAGARHWTPHDVETVPAPTVEIPVVYDGLDLQDVAVAWGMSTAEARRTHASIHFTVAFVGFAPGFAYLAGLPEELAIARLVRPRERVPAGAVAVADRYSAVYPLATPGGWRLLGTTSAVMWDLQRDPPALLTTGTRVRFVDITGGAAGGRAGGAGRGVTRGAVADTSDRRSRSSPGPVPDPGRTTHRNVAADERRVTIVRAGALTTVQDRGRSGYRHLAVGTAGVLDADAAALANRLVGNDADAAVLETTLDGVRLRFQQPTWFAVTGAECPLALDGQPVAATTAIAARAGAVLDVGAAVAGLRSYVAIDGGVTVGPVLGSRSYDTLARLGPPPLADGDVIPIGPPSTSAPAVDVVPRLPPTGAIEVELVAGPHVDRLPVGAAEALTAAGWTVSPSSSRIALRLDGAPLDIANVAELPSVGIVTGAVQVPPNGQPLVFLADHPTTGGYPLVAVVPEPDRSRLAQLRPGDTVRFRRTGPGWKTRPS